MAMNRVQFHASLSMPEFLNRYGSEQQCEAALVAARWPRGFACPLCGAGAHGTFVRGRRRYWQCAACRHQCSALSGTIFESTKLPLTRWFLAMHLLTQSKNNVSALELMRQLGVCYKSAWLLKHKLMEVMRVREAPRQLDGRVEIDDAYLGGERAGGKTGRGSENKVPFIAAVQTTPEGKPIYACFAPQPFTTEAVALFAASSLAPTAQVISDGLWCFGGVKIIGAEHERVVTGGGAASAKLPQFKAINTVLGNLKTALKGTYHAFAFAKYAHRYLAEVQYRFNRRFDLAAILARLLRAACLTPPRPAALLRLAEECR
ncbi:MAG TPA: IS1595 family transposase [Longimicrobiales bacterium]|jgi:ribosomal protein L37AE/L43A|nr:IS1595 family transposase [Longimicrobiales bacterium]